ncbi:MAG: L,D-transpeptidase family protein [Phycisphaerae bacterium]|nr:L,D-transpeptidase family protein [Phycisphaerae bacterium]MDD5381128.1 L,D-transpeptidase family protein [Phycisphaerae bacterium]
MSGRWMYVILALLIIAVVVAFVYKPHFSSRTKDTAVSADTAKPAESKTIMPAVKSAAEPATETEGEPNLLRFAQTTAEDNPWVAELITEAMSYIEARPVRIIDARDRLNETLPLPMSEQQRAIVKERLSEFADKWLFSRTIYPQDRLTGTYKVKPGDLLSTIGRQFKVPYEILMEINKIDSPEALRAGETIKIINGPFHTRVYLSTFTMDLYLQNTFVRSFPVGLGQPGMETPTGLWAVKEGGKMISPRWTDQVTGKTYEAEDEDYPLGSRWIGLEGIKGDAVGRTGFAIHGTKDPNGIGIAASQGCIRLHNGNAILVYNVLVPGDSHVEVVE